MNAAPRVLIAEDDLNDLELTQRALSRYRQGLSVMAFSDGSEIAEYLLALPPAAKAPELQPGLLLLDIKMPRMGGLEVLELIRDKELCPGVPIVVFSSSQEPRDIARAAASHANSFIRKPGDYVQYMETIRQVAGYWLELNVASV